ncbi:hypothetical protein MATL_G00055880 [Megalops atlanticus]|uniref:Uncharacterized protein n=1 Tax=Megalops atlanticus TaxID=7932 RepID=A0A9D3QAK7_MEGAT|nr:hypothetical protein MATL_G00055880 [Megalops atlanticus]
MELDLPASDNMNTQENPPSPADRETPVKTSDVYRVEKNLPERFNNPDRIQGYSKKVIHPLYRTTNQTYGGKKPTVHEMPTAFHGDSRRFTEHLLKSGMYRDHGLNTYMDTRRVTTLSAKIESQHRMRYHQTYGRNRKVQSVNTADELKR